MEPCTLWMMTGVRLVFLFFKAFIQWLLDEWEMRAVFSLSCCHMKSGIWGRTSLAVPACEYLKNKSFNNGFICRVALYLIF